MRRHVATIMLALAVCAGLLALRVSDPLLLAGLRSAGFDTLQRLWPRQSPPQPVTVVAIDEASLQKLGQWPWPRDRLAALLRALDALGAQVVAFDVLFPEADRLSPASLAATPALAGKLARADAAALPDFDKDFAAAIQSVPTVLVEATTSEDQAQVPRAKAGFASTGLDPLAGLPTIHGLVNNLPVLDEGAAGLGVISIDLASTSGVARSLPLLWHKDSQIYPALALEALRVATGQNTIVVNGSEQIAGAVNALRVGPLEIPTSEHGELFVYYHHNDPALFVPAAQILDPAQAQALRPQIAGHIVLIGATATGLLDTKVTSLGETVPGVAIHAQALEQMLSGDFLTRPEWTLNLELLYVALGGVAFAALSGILRPHQLITLFAGASAALALFVVGAFLKAGLLFDFTFPFFSMVSLFLSTLAFKLLVTERQGRALRLAFSHYVAAPVLSEIERNPAALSLGGEMREVTVMFADISNFTPLTERLEPQQLVAVINQIMEACTQEVLATHGTLDKYIGDALMAFWNAPTAVADHQYQAALAALQIRQALARLNANEVFAAPLKAKGLWPVGLRIGLATGPCIVGNMGSHERFDYSALGETVNMAARAEATCRHVQADILLAGPLAEKTKGLAMLDAGLCEFRGISQRKPCHAIFGTEKDEALALSQQALARLREGKTPQPTNLPEPYQRFLAQVAQRPADYAPEAKLPHAP